MVHLDPALMVGSQICAHRLQVLQVANMDLLLDNMVVQQVHQEDHMVHQVSLDLMGPLEVHLKIKHLVVQVEAPQHLGLDLHLRVEQDKVLHLELLNSLTLTVQRRFLLSLQPTYMAISRKSQKTQHNIEIFS